MSQGPSFSTFPLFHPVESLKQVSTVKSSQLPSYLSGSSQTKAKPFLGSDQSLAGQPRHKPAHRFPPCLGVQGSGYFLSVVAVPMQSAQPVDYLASGLLPGALSLFEIPETGTSEDRTEEANWTR